MLTKWKHYYLVLTNKTQNVMKKLKLLSLLVLLGFNSCQQMTVEQKIEKQFKAYVNENFDTPSSLKEIVSIKLHNTISMDSIVKKARETINISDVVDSISPLITDSDFIEYLKFIEPRNPNFRFKIEEMQTALKNLKSFDNLTYSVTKLNLKTELKDSIESDTVYTYKIKYRIETKNEMSLEDIYAIVDKQNNIKVCEFFEISDAFPAKMKFFKDNINTLERYSNDKFVLEQDLADILEAIREKDY